MDTKETILKALRNYREETEYYAEPNTNEYKLKLLSRAIKYIEEN